MLWAQGARHEPYIGTKIINAKPMTRLAYNELRGWIVPADENPADNRFVPWVASQTDMLSGDWSVID